MGLNIVALSPSGSITDSLGDLPCIGVGVSSFNTDTSYITS